MCIDKYLTFKDFHRLERAKEQVREREKLVISQRKGPPHKMDLRKINFISPSGGQEKALSLLELPLFRNEWPGGKKCFLDSKHPLTVKPSV